MNIKTLVSAMVVATLVGCGGGSSTQSVNPAPTPDKPVVTPPVVLPPVVDAVPPTLINPALDVITTDFKQYFDGYGFVHNQITVRKFGEAIFTFEYESGIHSHEAYNLELAQWSQWYFTEQPDGLKELLVDVGINGAYANGFQVDVGYGEIMMYTGRNTKINYIVDGENVTRIHDDGYDYYVLYADTPDDPTPLTQSLNGLYAMTNNVTHVSVTYNDIVINHDLTEYQDIINEHRANYAAFQDCFNNGICELIEEK